MICRCKITRDWGMDGWLMLRGGIVGGGEGWLCGGREIVRKESKQDTASSECRGFGHAARAPKLSENVNIILF